MSPCRRRRRRSSGRRSMRCIGELGAKHGAVRRLRDAGAIPARHHRRAPPHPRRRPGCSMSRIWARSRLAGDGGGRCAGGAGARRSAALAAWRMRYTLLLNEAGGILDDLMATRLEGGLFLVVNAARKEADLAHLARAPRRRRSRSSRSSSAHCWRCRGRPAAAVLSRFVASIARLPFMTRRAGRDRRPALPGDALRLYRRGRVRDFAAHR